jgi:hypothetical protein
MPEPSPDLPFVAERCRWIAAQRLAAGDAPVRAAAFAGIAAATLRALQDDPDFQDLVAAERQQLALPREAWARHMEQTMRQTAERALADGRVSTVNLVLRETAALRADAVPPGPHARAATMRAVAALDADMAEPCDEDEAEDEPQRRHPAAPVEAEPEREAARLALLARLPAWEQRAYAHCALALLEQHAAACDPDPTVYEAWLARQPKPEPAPVPLSAEDRAAIAHATRHNPP